MRRPTIEIALATLCAIALAGCNDGSVGSRCSGAPTEAVCVDGAVCAPDEDTSTAPPDPPNAVPSTCRQVCNSEADCAEPGFECRVVAGSMVRACQPEDDAIPAPVTDGGA